MSEIGGHPGRDLLESRPILKLSNASVKVQCVKGEKIECRLHKGGRKGRR